MKNCLILLILILFLGCKGEMGNSKLSQAYRVEVEPIAVPYPPTLDWDGVVENLNIIQLETTEQSLIGRIDKLQVFENTIYVLDTRITKSLFMFDMEGKLINKINRVGEAEGEYYLPFDFCINPFKRTIEIMEVRNRKIISYDLEGNFLTEWRIEGQLMDFIPLSQDRYAFHIDGRDWPESTKMDFLHIANRDHSQVYQSGVAEYSTTDFFRVRDNLAKTYDRVLYLQAMHDTIYSVSQDNVVPAYHLVFDEGHSLRSETKRLPPAQLRQKLMTDDYYLHRGNILETSELISFLWTKKEHGYKLKDPAEVKNDLWFTIYNKNSGAVNTLNAISEFEGHDFNYPVHANNDFFIVLLIQSSLMQM